LRDSSEIACLTPAIKARRKASPPASGRRLISGRKPVLDGVSLRSPVPCGAGTAPGRHAAGPAVR